jgi:iron complex outermembrane recepter protein
LSSNQKLYYFMKKITFLLFLFAFSFGYAQKEVSGKVSDSSGIALPGVNVVEKGTTNGTSTDSDGNYRLKVQDTATLVFSYVGFGKIEKSAANTTTIDAILSESGGQTLDDVVVVGTRTAPRSNTTSALPVDVLTARDLTSTGQATFDKALQYRVPSFNTVNTPVNDATSLLDPYEIRNMGPSRTLILINGKRKNLSSLVYVQTSPGRGETGADISAIPTDAIERVEILRDGASAQYGSDAIAGVMNIILKKNTNGGSATLRAGATGKGDGETYGISLNNGTTVGEKGFVNYTIDFSKTALANRPGVVSAAGEIDPDYGLTGASDLPAVQAFLASKPDAGNINGSPETAAAKFLVNGGRQLSETTELYYNAAYVYKKVNSFANYRTPYWRSAASFPYLPYLYGNGTLASYQGYVPDFQGELNDYNATLGYKFKNNGWNTDVSFTTGGNDQNYTIGNSHNRSADSAGNLIYAATPTEYTGPVSFNPGGVGFTHYVGNIDVNKNITDEFSVGFGSEVRSEVFEVREGDEASYVGVGADSYQGNRPENVGKFNRYNLGFYLSATYDATKDLLFEGTARYEDYSDFGDKTVWKLSSRYKFMEDKVTLRGSISTGFRAPTLHQIYTQKVQSSFSGGTIQLEGIINNLSSAARRNNVAALKAETSTNYTVGLGFKPFKNFSATLDYYSIGVKDRIVLSDKVGDVNGGVISYFANAIDTKTSGIDIVANYKNIELGNGKLGVNYSANFSLENKLDGAIRQNTTVSGDLFGLTQQALLLSSRPYFKHIIGLDYEVNKLSFNLNNTVFGPSKFKNADLFDKEKLSVKFLTKIVSDLGVSFKASDKMTLSLNVNNLLNVLPEWELFSENGEAVNAILSAKGKTIEQQNNALTFNGRYSQMTYDGSHFSQLGTIYNLSLNYKF